MSRGDRGQNWSTNTSRASRRQNGSTSKPRAGNTGQVNPLPPQPQSADVKGQSQGAASKTVKSEKVEPTQTERTLPHSIPQCIFYKQDPVNWPAALVKAQFEMKRSAMGGENAKWGYHKLLLSFTKLLYLDPRGRSTGLQTSDLQSASITSSSHNELYLLAEKIVTFCGAEHTERVSILNNWPFCYPSQREMNGHKSAIDFVEGQLIRAKDFSSFHFENGTFRPKIAPEKTSDEQVLLGETNAEVGANAEEAGAWTVVKPPKAYNHRKARKR